MVKTVFDNRQCAHVWAAQTQASGRSHNGNLYFEHERIYSYRKTWPLAAFTSRTHEGKRVVLLNTESVSVTTSGHLSDVRGALDGLDVYTVAVPSSNLVYDAVHAYSDEARTRAYVGIVNRYVRKAEKGVERWSNFRRLDWSEKANYTRDRDATPAELLELRLMHATKAHAMIATIKAALGVDGVPQCAPFDVVAAHQAITEAHTAYFDPKAVAKREKDAAKRADKAALVNLGNAINRVYKGSAYVTRNDRHKLESACTTAVKTKGLDATKPYLSRIAKYQAVREVDALFDVKHPGACNLKWSRNRSTSITLDEWREGKSGYVIDYSTTALRRKGNMLETSRGAQVPWRDAERLFVLAQSVVHRGVHYVPEHPVRCGAFTLREIRADGTTIIGCHTLAFAEMERLAIREAQHLVKPRYPLPALVAA